MKDGRTLTRRAFGSVALGATATLALARPSVLRAQVPLTFVVPNPSAITFAPYWVALGEGYFDEEGLSPSWEAVDGSSAVIQAMSAGQAQIGAPGPGPTLGARARGVDIKFLYNMYPKSVFGVLVKDDSPAQTPEDLKGTVIGVGTADGAEVSFIRSIMADKGLIEGSDYELMPVGDGGTAAVAFLRGDVSSYIGAVSDAAILASKGLVLREITPEPFMGFFGNGIAMLESQMAATPDLAPKFGRALVRAMRFSSDPANLEKAVAHCAAGNRQEGEDKAFATALLQAATDRMTPTAAFAEKGFGYQPPEHWKMVHDSAVASGALQSPMADLASIYTNDFVADWNAS